MWWTGNSCCFIGFCGTFLVLSGPSGDLAGPTSGAIIILPWRTNQKVQGSSVAFILWFGSGTNNVHSWSTQDTQGRCSALKKKKKRSVLRKSRRWKFLEAVCVCVHRHACVFTCTLEGLSLWACVWASASVYSCLYWWKMSLGRKAQSSKFKFRFHFDDAVCLVKSPRGEEAEEELWRENQRTRVEDW